jgi:chromosome segregation ATPase
MTSFACSLAEMIAERSKTTQFIMISHRPELVEIAEKHYKMEYANRVSNVIHVDKEDAVELVRRGDEEDEDEEEEEEE